VLVLGAAFAALVVGNLVISWPRVVARTDAFVTAVLSGDPPQMIAALTSTPVILLLLSTGIAVSLVLQRQRRSA
jgi:hypothetical protein